jgi:D-threo-aldose 1-dehydrogenase
VTRLGLGTAPLGGLYRATDEIEALDLVRRAWTTGLRFFDTAPLYGHGLAELRLGRVLCDYPRSEFTLATKVGRLLRDDAPPPSDPGFFGTPPVSPIFDFSYDGVLRSIDESQERLGIERFDILYIHDPDDYYEEALAGAFPALAKLRSEGVVGAIGVGMNQAQMLGRFAREADVDCFLLAGRYTLLDQVALEELLPLCVERGITIVAGGVYNSGILADPEPGAHYDYAQASAEMIRRAQRLGDVCARHDVPLKAAAIQFPLGHPAVSSVVIGCRSVAELDDNLLMFGIDIPGQLWIDLKAEGLLPVEAPTP